MEKQALSVLWEHRHAIDCIPLSQGEPERSRDTSCASGLNILKRSKHTALAILGRPLKSSLVYVLAFATIFSFVLRDLSHGSIITVIPLINTSLSFFQEYRSEQAVQKLSTFI